MSYTDPEWLLQESNLPVSRVSTERAAICA
jgi:hypothetical protein